MHHEFLVALPDAANHRSCSSVVPALTQTVWEGDGGGAYGIMMQVSAALEGRAFDLTFDTISNLCDKLLRLHVCDDDVTPVGLLSVLRRLVFEALPLFPFVSNFSSSFSFSKYYQFLFILSFQCYCYLFCCSGTS